MRDRNGSEELTLNVHDPNPDQAGIGCHVHHHAVDVELGERGSVAGHSGRLAVGGREQWNFRPGGLIEADAFES